ncbi:hypothetical protein KSP40_PGU008400 [Platanthera guangdongensis]|uniref:Uncharacterized protein n=1 Tax=Platanthera guangdongensis TaxID=2320717 RepID=A0ABR2M2D7_9ASPA
MDVLSTSDHEENSPNQSCPEAVCKNAAEKNTETASSLKSLISASLNHLAKPFMPGSIDAIMQICGNYGDTSRQTSQIPASSARHSAPPPPSQAPPAPPAPPRRPHVWARHAPSEFSLSESIVRRPGKAPKGPFPTRPLACTRRPVLATNAAQAVRRQPMGSGLGPPWPILRTNHFPKVTDPFCRLPLSTLFHRPEAVHLGDLMRL